MKRVVVYSAVLFWNLFCINSLAVNDEEVHAATYIKQLDEKKSLRTNKLTLASWAYESNITDANEEKLLALSAESAKEDKKEWQETIQFDWQNFKDESLKRQFKKYSILGTAALPPKKFSKLEKTIKKMEEIYAKAKICEFKEKSKCELSLEPEITNILAKSRNHDELKHAWVAWRHKTKAAKEHFKEYVALSNEAAQLNNFTSVVGLWLHDYEDPDFQNKIKQLWEQVKPLYLQLHAYVRSKLRQKYGDVVSEKGPIPAHLLGNMWAQTWQNVLDFTLPYPDVKDVDVSEEMIKQKYTPLKMFKMAEEFFVSLNLGPMTPEFWERSIIEKPTDGRDLVCHASAWEFSDKQDFRIKQCTTVNFEELNVIHHEMGHIQYYMQYKDQPLIFREGANDGFHEAVGDVIALSVSTRKHLKAIGLLNPDVPDSEEAEINNMFKIALERLAFLPFGYLIDMWRWEVFEGSTIPDNYNCNWWKYRTDIQGIEPPVDRSEDDFDPAGKYHIVADVPYIRYFISHIVEFQFHKAACEIAKEYIPGDPTKPLHKCDIYKSKEAGLALGKMLAMGSSRPWPDAMEALTGQREMDASSVLEYFKPLQKWLEAENKKNNAYIGWEATKRKCTKSA